MKKRGQIDIYLIFQVEISLEYLHFVTCISQSNFLEKKYNSDAYFRLGLVISKLEYYTFKEKGSTVFILYFFFLNKKEGGKELMLRWFKLCTSEITTFS